MVDKALAARDVHVYVRKHQARHGLSVVFEVDTDHECRLHWGLTRSRKHDWQRPPETLWPVHTEPYNQYAVQTPLAQKSRNSRTTEIRLPDVTPWQSLPFVLFFPEDNEWLKNGKSDFVVSLRASKDGGIRPKQALEKRVKGEQWSLKTFDLGPGQTLAAAVSSEEKETRVVLVSDAEAPLLLHWGLAETLRYQWALPSQELWPKGTRQFDDKAVQTPFSEQDGLSWLEFRIWTMSSQPPPKGLNFVLFQPDEELWLKDKNKDMHLSLAQGAAESGPLLSAQSREFADEIISAEAGKQSWTLMHRYNLCHRLLNEVPSGDEEMMLLFVWLRFSALRQLDWQRRYNTKPRELAHAQERLTNRLAEAYGVQANHRFWIRGMLQTLGRGGEGQKVRDQILHIMHRHDIKEAGGTFLEQWHQKLHNNTTPDDVVICEAYLAFLHSGGDLAQFYEKLEGGGVTQGRLHSFERPINTDPQFFADKQAGLSYDFEQFLSTLKSVHSGTDMDIAAGSARSVLDDDLNHRLNAVYDQWHQNASLLEQTQTLTELRETLSRRLLEMQSAHVVREMLYLDLALEQTLRTAIERQELADLDAESLLLLAALLLRNVSFSIETEEFDFCSAHLSKVVDMNRQAPDWGLHAKAAVERAASAFAEWSKAIYQRLQPKAEFLGRAVGVEEWVIPLFSEEVLRGALSFPTSLVLHRLDGILRQQAGMSRWQIISPANATGTVRVLERLAESQGQRFEQTTIIVTDTVTGEEEIPGNVSAVITLDAPDLMSHVSIRARQAGLLFASCFDTDAYCRLESMKDRQLTFKIAPSGDVEWRENNSVIEVPDAVEPTHKGAIRPRPFTSWAVPSSDFSEDNVGKKSLHIQALKRKASDDIHVPGSMAVPFGVFEEVLHTRENQHISEEVQSYLDRLSENPEAYLASFREAILKLKAPKPFQASLQEVWQKACLPSVGWQDIWHAVKRVWASQWNERAFYSREALGVSHSDLRMAVLIQQVIEADYAFVVHTVNPITKAENELFAEVVIGMGETLVANEPGRALSYVSHKSDLQITLLSYPSKRLAQYGHGVIFRSDSNAEDLDEYSGAGLYDSFLAQPAQLRIVDYAKEPLLWNERFRSDLLRKLVATSVEVERTMGAPQDIEGAVAGDRVHIVQSRPQVGLL